MKSDKIPYNIYPDLESLIKKIDGYAMSTIWAFDHGENKHILHRGKVLYFFQRTCYKHY